MVEMQSLAIRSSGRVDAQEALHAYLALVVLPCAGIEVIHPHFEAVCLSNRQAVYLCREQQSCAHFVCKFFGHRWYLSQEERRELLNHEFNSLSALRDIGFCEFPDRVVRPLSKNEEINCLLVEEFAHGHDLDYYIAKAAYEGQHDRLFQKLTQLAHFLAQLHNRTASRDEVNFSESLAYFRHVVDSLARLGLIDDSAVAALRDLSGEWERSAAMWADLSVMIHGDATPTNFIFHPEDGVTAIDLERMRPADRVHDVGVLMAELKHHFAWRTRRADAAEPFIGYFLRAYCEDFPDPESTFDAVTRRNQFYMALGELRIARNEWLNWEHRKWLVDEARRCLQL